MTAVDKMRLDKPVVLRAPTFKFFVDQRTKSLAECDYSSSHLNAGNDKSQCLKERPQPFLLGLDHNELVPMLENVYTQQS